MDISRSTKRIRKDLETCACFGGRDKGGTTRLPFTKEMEDCAVYLKKQMQEAGLEVRVDAAGNVIGRMEGETPETIMIGSHYDSVRSGGNFDGIAGVISGIELVRLLRENKKKIKNAIEIIGFCDEEGARFSMGYFGSKCMLGQFQTKDCKKYRDCQGITIYEAMKGAGFDPERLSEAVRDWDHIRHFYEIHVEQGPVLWNKGLEIGIVDGIVGIARRMIYVYGRADHAGSTPMNMRSDAVEMAAAVAVKIPEWARESRDGTVATTGIFSVKDGEINTVAKEASFSVDIRSLEEKSITEIEGKIKLELENVCRRLGGTYKIVPKLDEKPLSLDEKNKKRLESACKKLNYSFCHLASGAGHDSLVIGRRIPATMIFVPSKEGRSHCPEEWTDYQAIARAVHVLYEIL